MKKFLTALSASLILLSCSSVDKPSEIFTLDNFPKEWINVEQKENKWIIFEPCDAGTPELKFSKENGKNIFTELLGQAADLYSIEKFEQNSDSSVTVSIKFEGGPEGLKYVFRKTDQKNIWSVKAPDNMESHYVEKQYAGSFTKVVQPCRECWEEADCAEMEKGK